MESNFKDWIKLQKEISEKNNSLLMMNVVKKIEYSEIEANNKFIKFKDIIDSNKKFLEELMVKKVDDNSKIVYDMLRKEFTNSINSSNNNNNNNQDNGFAELYKRWDEDIKQTNEKINKLKEDLWNKLFEWRENNVKELMKIRTGREGSAQVIIKDLNKIEISDVLKSNEEKKNVSKYNIIKSDLAKDVKDLKKQVEELKLEMEKKNLW